MPPGRAAGLELAVAFVEAVKTSGVLREAIDRAGIRGARVAPPVAR